MDVKTKDISDADVEAVEAEVGMGCGAWDCVDPKELIAACTRVIALKFNLE